MIRPEALKNHIPLSDKLLSLKGVMRSLEGVFKTSLGISVGTGAWEFKLKLPPGQECTQNAKIHAGVLSPVLKMQHIDLHVLVIVPV